MGSWLDRAVLVGALTGCGGHVNAGASDASVGPPDCGAATVCGNDCAVLTEDSRHCGSCGNDCGGGGCVNGACQNKVEVASGGLRLAINSGDVVWTDGAADAGGGVFKCAKWGCGARPTAVFQSSNGPDYLGPLAVTDARVYWSGVTNLLACPLSGCSGPDTFGDAAYRLLATDGVRVYWYSDTTSMLVACPVSGCTGATPFPTYIAGPIVALALGATGVFWAVKASGGPGVYVASCPLSGCGGHTDVTFVSGERGVDAIAVDAANVYWTGPSLDDASHSTIQRCPLAGCPNLTGIPLASGQPKATSIATDGVNVYWGNEGMAADGGAPALPGAVMRCAVGGCGGNPTVAADSPGGAVSVAVDDKSIYWIKLPEGTGKPSIMKTAK